MKNPPIKSPIASVNNKQLINREQYTVSDGVNDYVLFDSESLANATIEIRILYKSSEYQFMQLSDDVNTNRYLSATMNSAIGNTGQIGIDTRENTGDTTQSGFYISGQSWSDDDWITIIINTDGNGDISSATANDVSMTNSGVSESRANSGGGNHFYIGARFGSAFAYKGLIDYFKFDNATNCIKGYNHQGWNGGTVGGSPTNFFETIT